MGETETGMKSQFTAPKVVALIALLMVFKEGVNNWWIGYHLLPFPIGFGYGTIGVLQLILAAILMIAIIATVVDLKIAFLKKLYHWIPLLIIGGLMLILEFSGVLWNGVAAWQGVAVAGELQIGAILGGLLVLIAALIEILLKWKENLSVAKILTLIGVLCALVDVILLGVGVSNGLVDQTSGIYYIVVGIICMVLLLLIIQNKVNVKLKFAWWLILIIGFIFFTWYTGAITGIIILIAFIVMIRE
ncbi:MAG: hypothetical protein ACFFAT_16655 [Promethearchaeota archaeon]